MASTEGKSRYHSLIEREKYNGAAVYSEFFASNKYLVVGLALYGLYVFIMATLIYTDVVYYLYINFTDINNTVISYKKVIYTLVVLGIILLILLSINLYSAVKSKKRLEITLTSTGIIAHLRNGEVVFCKYKHITEYKLTTKFLDKFFKAGNLEILYSKKGKNRFNKKSIIQTLYRYEKPPVPKTLRIPNIQNVDVIIKHIKKALDLIKEEDMLERNSEEQVWDYHNETLEMLNGNKTYSENISDVQQYNNDSYGSDAHTQYQDQNYNNSQNIDNVNNNNQDYNNNSDFYYTDNNNQGYNENN